MNITHIYTCTCIYMIQMCASTWTQNLEAYSVTTWHSWNKMHYFRIKRFNVGKEGGYCPMHGCLFIHGMDFCSFVWIIYIYLHTHIHINTHTHTNMNMDARTHTHTHTHTYMHRYVHRHVKTSKAIKIEAICRT
jgi:hypothetical protein